MRVIGGRFRGRRLLAPEGEATRPTASRVREALFDILQSRVEGALFLDLFAGTGAVGIEAISRGAAQVLFVERAPKALRALKENLDMLGASPQAQILPVEAGRALELIAARPDRLTLGFADPPYAHYSQPREGWLAGLAAPQLWASDAVLVLEHPHRDALTAPTGFEPGRSYRYGETALSLFHWGGGNP